jgi:hypothetical protein
MTFDVILSAAAGTMAVVGGAAGGAAGGAIGGATGGPAGTGGPVVHVQCSQA